MAHHKRKRPKNRRAGCLMCKPHKANGADKRTMQDRKADESQKEQQQWTTVTAKSGGRST